MKEFRISIALPFILLLTWSAPSLATFEHFAPDTANTSYVPKEKIAFAELRMEYKSLIFSHNIEEFTRKWHDLDDKTRHKLATVTWEKTTLLMIAAAAPAREDQENRPDIVNLICPLSPPKAQNENLQTALHMALDAKNFAIAKALIECGADLNIKDLRGMSPFVQIVFLGYRSLFDLAVQKGAAFETRVSQKSLLFFAFEGFNRFLPGEEKIAFKEPPQHQYVIDQIRARGYRRLSYATKTLTFTVQKKILSKDQRLFSHEAFKNGEDPHELWFHISDEAQDPETLRSELHELALDECYGAGFEESDCITPMGQDPLQVEGPFNKHQTISINGQKSYVLFKEYTLIYTLIVEQEDDVFIKNL